MSKVFSAYFKQEMLQHIVGEVFEDPYSKVRERIEHLLLKNGALENVPHWRSWVVVCNGRVVKLSDYSAREDDPFAKTISINPKVEAKLAEALDEERQLYLEKTKAEAFIRKAFTMVNTIEDIFSIFPSGLHKYFDYLRNHPKYRENDPDSISPEALAEFQKETADSSLLINDRALKNLLLR